MSEHAYQLSVCNSAPEGRLRTRSEVVTGLLRSHGMALPQIYPGLSNMHPRFTPDLGSQVSHPVGHGNLKMLDPSTSLI